jgi:hypothetical protein
MAYAQDTIISADAANEFATVLDGLLLSAGWTVVETLNPAGTNTPTTKVYLSSALDNQCGYDWYLALMWKGVGTEAQVQIIGGAAYDQPTHIISQIPAQLEAPSMSSSRRFASPVTGELWGGVNVNVATATSTTIAPLGDHSAAGTQNKPFFAVIIPSSAFGYWMSVTLDHVGVYTTIPGFYFVSSLDVDPDYAALDATFGNGVNTSPVVGFFNNGASTGLGISATVIGTGMSSTEQISPQARRAATIGAFLPALDNAYLPAYAWRDAWYLRSIDYASASAGASAPIWADTGVGDGFHIGDGIDWYCVYGGSIGDTVEIAGGTYVLSGLLTGSQLPDAGTGVYIALLVE